MSSWVDDHCMYKCMYMRTRMSGKAAEGCPAFAKKTEWDEKADCNLANWGAKKKIDVYHAMRVYRMLFTTRRTRSPLLPFVSSSQSPHICH